MKYKDIVIKSNQNIFDVALSHSGSALAIISYALINNTSITEDLMPSETFTIKETEYDNINILNYYELNNINPATGVNNYDIAFLSNIQIVKSSINILPNQVIINTSQNIFDIALQTTGTVTSVIDIALLNDVSITDDLLANSTFKVPTEIPNNSFLFQYKKQNIKPATGKTLNPNLNNNQVLFENGLFENGLFE